MTPAPRPTLIASLAVTGLVLAACGGDDDTAATTAPPVVSTEADDGSTDDEPEPAPGGPVRPPDATVAAGIPDEVLSEIGPVEVIGDALALGVGADDPAIGQPAPRIIGVDFNFTPTRIDAVADGPTMVVFLAHWCPVCNNEIPRINALRDTGSFPDGLNIIGVATSVNPTSPNFPPGQWLRDMDWTYPVIADGIDMEAETFIAATAFGVSAFPFTVLIDGDGNVAERWSGERSADAVIASIAAIMG